MGSQTSQLSYSNRHPFVHSDQQQQQHSKPSSTRIPLSDSVHTSHTDDTSLSADSSQTGSTMPNEYIYKDRLRSISQPIDYTTISTADPTSTIPTPDGYPNKSPSHHHIRYPEHSNSHHHYHHIHSRNLSDTISTMKTEWSNGVSTQSRVQPITESSQVQHLSYTSKYSHTHPSSGIDLMETSVFAPPTTVVPKSLSSPYDYPFPNSLDDALPYQWYSWPEDTLPPSLAKIDHLNEILETLKGEARPRAGELREHIHRSGSALSSTRQSLPSLGSEQDDSDNDNNPPELLALANELFENCRRSRKPGALIHMSFPDWYTLRSQKTFLRDEPVDSFRYSQKRNDLIPCVFNWSHGGHTVYLTGSFDNWSTEKKIKLVRSGHEFTAIKELPRAIHYYKFIVDDQWRFSPNQPTHTDENGNVNNILNLCEYESYNFIVPKEHEQAREATYHQFVPGSNDYTTDAPVIPILLSKSNCIAAEPPSRISAPLHALSNHLYHDSHAAHLFGPHITCVTSTQRWRHAHKSLLSTAELRFSTIIYVTFNPLFPEHGSPAFELHAASPLRSLVVAGNRGLSKNNGMNNKFKTEFLSSLVSSSHRESVAQDAKRESDVTQDDDDELRSSTTDSVLLSPNLPISDIV